MEDNPSAHKGVYNPVNNVSWYDCQEFIRKLNNLTDQNFKLPTEAQWEYAARGGNNSKGYKYAGSNVFNDVAWDEPNSVGTKLPNELGLYDMTGNVWEWCDDWYDVYSSTALVNPTGPDTGLYRVIRWGGWDMTTIKTTITDRDFKSPEFVYHSLGLRLCL
jgi:formylglycine-generating enzyme required for sulfatase activity